LTRPRVPGPPERTKVRRRLHKSSRSRNVDLKQASNNDRQADLLTKASDAKSMKQSQGHGRRSGGGGSW
jgi:hypothetical protein